MVTGRRPRDTVRVEVVGGGSLDNFTSFQIVNDITMPSEASFEVGDDGTWSSMGDVFKPGTKFCVYINDRPRLTGRVEMNDVPFDTQAGAVVRFTVRTKLSDAMYASAPKNVKVKDTSIQEFVLAVYQPLGYVLADFVFSQATARDLLTGRVSDRGVPDTNLEPIKVEEAKVQPSETIYAAVDRHLRRHGFMHWDAPDGRIIVGKPDDLQNPLFTFNMFRSFGGGGDPESNNVLGSTRTRDWSGIPSLVEVFGKGGKKGFGKSNVTAAASDADVFAAGFYRPISIIAEGVRTIDLAVRAANRELAARSKRKDGFGISVDGLSWWDGQSSVIYGPDTVAMINTDVAGGNAGAYYIHAVTLMRNASAGDTAQLDMVKRGIWKL